MIRGWCRRRSIWRLTKFENNKPTPMKTGIDSYCYHRYFGEIYPDQTDPGQRWTFRDFVKRAVELKADGVSLESCFFESLDWSTLAGWTASSGPFSSPTPCLAHRPCHTAVTAS